MAEEIKRHLGDKQNEEQKPILWEGKPVADGDKPLREKIVKVAKMIGGPSGMLNKIDANAPEYYSLAGSVSDEECDFILSLGLRKIRTDEWVSKKLGWSMDRIHKVGDHLGYLGAVRVDYVEAKNGTPAHYEYFCPIFAPGILEIMVVSPNAETHPEIRRAFNQYTHDRLQSMGPMIPEGYGLMRVIPIKRALEKSHIDQKDIDPRDDLDKWLDAYDYFSIGACSCRTSRTAMGEGCGHLAKDRCLKLGTPAKYFVRTGKDREISKEEAKELLLKCEDEGLMHCVPNLDSWKDQKSTAICDCCGCACFGLRPVEEFKTTDAVASNYRCEVNALNCVACGKCVENCPTNAIRLGVKLPEIKETKIHFQQSLLKNTTEKVVQNPDYRFNREDVIPETGTAPCKTWCPAHISIQGYIKLASEGKYREALELIKRENPFPAVCGRICNHPCEQHCTRRDVDQAIAIDDIKKFIAQKDIDSKDRYVPAPKHTYTDREAYTSKKIAIIGAGPSGLACAFYLAQDGYDITVFEKEEKVGGMLTLGIPAFRLEKDVVEAEIDIIKEMGVKFRTGVEVGKDVTIPQLRKEGFKGFYVAIGAQSSRMLGIPNEDNPEILGGIDFLKDVNLGKGKKLHGTVVVVGGGNVAMDVARAAIRQGAESVELYCLEQRDEMPSSADEIKEAEDEGVHIHNGWGPLSFDYDENHILTGISFKKCTSVRDENHRFNPKYDESVLEHQDCVTVLKAIGQGYEYGHLFDGTKVTFTKRHTVEADPLTKQTLEEDIFVGGDVYNGPSFAINAIADGHAAAISLDRYVQPGQLLDAGRDRRDYHELDKKNVNFSKIEETPGFDNTPRSVPADRCKDDVHSYVDYRGFLTEDQIKKEGARCLSCGKAVVDPNMCVGCGQCVLQCEFDAAHLVKKTSIYAKEYSSLFPKAIGHTLKRGIKISLNALKRE